MTEIEQDRLEKYWRKYRWAITWKRAAKAYRTVAKVWKDTAQKALNQVEVSTFELNKIRSRSDDLERLVDLVYEYRRTKRNHIYLAMLALGKCLYNERTTDKRNPDCTEGKRSTVQDRNAA